MEHRFGSVTRTVLVPFVISRGIVVAALLLTRHVFTTLKLAEPLQTRDGLLAWDASWYRDIAHGGYGAVGRDGLRFFPLFPLLGRAVAWLPGVGAAFGVVFVANAAALVLGYVVYALARHERDDDLARRAVWLVYLVPPAFVLVMGYSEAVFMVAVAVTLLGLRSERWWVAAIAGLVAGLTRPVGVLLAVPATVEALQRREPKAIAPAVTPAAGMLVYLAWARNRADGFWYPLRTQQDPTRRGEWLDPFRAVGHAVRELVHGDHVSAGVHAVAAIIFALLLIVLARRWPLSFTLYAAAGLVVALSSRNLDSLERYGLATVPFVLAGADVTAKPEYERVVLILAAAGLACASVLAFTGVLVP